MFGHHLCQRYKEETDACVCVVASTTPKVLRRSNPFVLAPSSVLCFFLKCFFVPNLQSSNLPANSTRRKSPKMPTPSHRSKASSKKRAKGSAKKATKSGKVEKTKTVTKANRSLSSYMLWLQKEGRAAVKAEFPKATFGETGKRCGEMWRALSSEVKNKYKAAAEKLKKASQQAQSSIKGGGRSDDDDDDSDDDGDSDDDDDDDGSDDDYSEE